jgi:hypothetical protein
VIMKEMSCSGLSSADGNYFIKCEFILWPSVLFLLTHFHIFRMHTLDVLDKCVVLHILLLVDVFVCCINLKKRMFGFTSRNAW